MTHRDRLLQRAMALSFLSILVNGLAGGTAVLAGVASGSLSLLGFGFDAAVDSVASVALIWRFSVEAREPHRARHVEHLTERIVGAVLLMLALYLGASAVRALLEDAHPEATVAGTALLLVSMVVLPPLAVAKYRHARAMSSGALRADSVLTAIAALLALVSFVGLGLAELFRVTWADAGGALIVTVILIREGWAALWTSGSGGPPQH